MSETREELKIRARIIKGIGGFYYAEPLDPLFLSGISEDRYDPETVRQVLENPPEISIECKPRGIFRHKKMKPAIGDLIALSPDSEGGWVITEIEDRRNSFIRPAVVNVDIAVICFALTKPAPDLLLLDKLLIQAQLNSVDPVICFTKRDTDTQGAFENYSRIYEPAGFPVIGLSAKEDDSFPELTERIAGKTAFLAGPSGVGKSTLINRISSAEMDTGELSQKLGRGRHTTRHVELLPGLSGGWLVDTPGFTSLELEQQITPEELADWYPEFAEAQCRFADCVHISEPGCAVRTAVDSGEIAKERYDSYKTLYKQLKNRKVRY